MTENDVLEELIEAAKQAEHTASVAFLDPDGEATNARVSAQADLEKALARARRELVPRSKVREMLALAACAGAWGMSQYAESVEEARRAVATARDAGIEEDEWAVADILLSELDTIQ